MMGNCLLFLLIYVYELCFVLAAAGGNGPTTAALPPGAFALERADMAQ